MYTRFFSIQHLLPCLWSNINFMLRIYIYNGPVDINLPIHGLWILQFSVIFSFKAKKLCYFYSINPQSLRTKRNRISWVSGGSHAGYIFVRVCSVALTSSVFAISLWDLNEDAIYRAGGISMEELTLLSLLVWVLINRECIVFHHDDPTETQ